MLVLFVVALLSELRLLWLFKPLKDDNVNDVRRDCGGGGGLSVLQLRRRR